MKYDGDLGKKEGAEDVIQNSEEEKIEALQDDAFVSQIEKQDVALQQYVIELEALTIDIQNAYRGDAREEGVMTDNPDIYTLRTALQEAMREVRAASFELKNTKVLSVHNVQRRLREAAAEELAHIEVRSIDDIQQISRIVGHFHSSLRDNIMLLARIHSSIERGKKLYDAYTELLSAKMDGANVEGSYYRSSNRRWIEKDLKAAQDEIAWLISEKKSIEASGFGLGKIANKNRLQEIDSRINTLSEILDLGSITADSRILETDLKLDTYARSDTSIFVRNAELKIEDYFLRESQAASTEKGTADLRGNAKEMFGENYQEDKALDTIGAFVFQTARQLSLRESYQRYRRELSRVPIDDTYEELNFDESNKIKNIRYETNNNIRGNIKWKIETFFNNSIRTSDDVKKWKEIVGNTHIRQLFGREALVSIDASLREAALRHWMEKNTLYRPPENVMIELLDTNSLPYVASYFKGLVRLPELFLRVSDFDIEAYPELHRIRTLIQENQENYYEPYVRNEEYYELRARLLNDSELAGMYADGIQWIVQKIKVRDTVDKEYDKESATLFVSKKEFQALCPEYSIIDGEEFDRESDIARTVLKDRGINNFFQEQPASVEFNQRSTNVEIEPNLYNLKKNKLVIPERLVAYFIEKYGLQPEALTQGSKRNPVCDEIEALWRSHDSRLLHVAPIDKQILILTERRTSINDWNESRNVIENILKSEHAPRAIDIFQREAVSRKESCAWLVDAIIAYYVGSDVNAAFLEKARSSFSEEYLMYFLIPYSTMDTKEHVEIADFLTTAWDQASLHEIFSRDDAKSAFKEQMKSLLDESDFFVKSLIDLMNVRSNEEITWLRETLLKHYLGENADGDFLKSVERSLSSDYVEKRLKPLRQLPLEQRPLYLSVMVKIQDSPSQEIQRVAQELIDQILSTDNPVLAYAKIESVFIKNNLPMVGKAFKIFRILHPTIQTFSHLSPVLHASSQRKKEAIIYQDLLRVHIDSANRSLRLYLEVLDSGKKILEIAEEKGVEHLSAADRKKLEAFLMKMETLYVNSTLGKRQGDTLHGSPASPALRLEQLRKSMRVRAGQSMPERIEEMFLSSIGAKSINEVLARMREKKREAHERGLQYAQTNNYTLESGDLLKGVDADHISKILQNGSVAKEYLGAGAKKDSTPYDTDVSMVLEEHTEKGFNATVGNSIAAGYGQLLFVVKDRGQFQHTTQDTHAYENKKLELFQAKVTDDKRHYGIRTGFGATEIDFMIAQPGLSPHHFENTCYHIAQNGYYIPITDQDGNVLFTLEMYKEHRKIFDGIEQFDGDPFEVISTSSASRQHDALQKMKRAQHAGEHDVQELSKRIVSSVQSILEESGISFLDPEDTSIVGAEVRDIGSTSRSTHMPDIFDFDFVLKLDAKDFSQASHIADRLRANTTFVSNNSHSESNGYYQLRLSGVTEVQGVSCPSFDLDIGISSKSDLAVFETHDAMAEKLAWIRRHLGGEQYREVLANIVLAKKTLKEAGVYKRVGEGGLGGIGAENWVMAHGGNMLEAFRSFYKAAYRDGKIVPFQEFKDSYKIIDAGANVKYNGRHDNFTYNMTDEGYKKTLQVIEEYLKVNE